MSLNYVHRLFKTNKIRPKKLKMAIKSIKTAKSYGAFTWIKYHLTRCKGICLQNKTETFIKKQIIAHQNPTNQ